MHCLSQVLLFHVPRVYNNMPSGYDFLKLAAQQQCHAWKMIQDTCFKFSFSTSCLASDILARLKIVLLAPAHEVGGGYCHHNLWLCDRVSVFRFQTISWKLLAGLFSYCIHTSLRGCRCVFWGL